MSVSTSFRHVTDIFPRCILLIRIKEEEKKKTKLMHRFKRCDKKTLTKMKWKSKRKMYQCNHVMTLLNDWIVYTKIIVFSARDSWLRKLLYFMQRCTNLPRHFHSITIQFSGGFVFCTCDVQCTRAKIVYKSFKLAIWDSFIFSISIIFRTEFVLQQFSLRYHGILVNGNILTRHNPQYLPPYLATFILFVVHAQNECHFKNIGVCWHLSHFCIIVL